MRGDNLPLAVHVHPHVRETVVVIVGLPLRHAFFVVRSGNNSRVPVHSNAQTRHFGDLDVQRRISVVSDVSRFAECAPVFHGDDEVVGEERLHGRDIPMLIRGIPCGL